MQLLSRISGVRTVGSLRIKKQSGSTHRGLHMWAPVSGVFDKLREVGVSSYLFYSWFKYFVNVCVELRS